MEITKQDFLNRVDRVSCKGTATSGGRAKEGHENCNICQGNYLHDGECNFGGQHTIDNDLRIINQNFGRFELLQQNQDNLSRAVSEKDFNQQKQKLIDDYQFLIRKCEADKLDFFEGTCISIESKQHIFLEKIKQVLREMVGTIKFFVQEAQELDWNQLKNYREKTERLEKALKEAAQTAANYEDAVRRGDKAEAERLLGLLNKQKQTINSLKAEITLDPIDKLLGEKTKKTFDNIVRSIWKGEVSDLFDFIKKEKHKKKQEGERKIWGFIPQKHWKK